MSEVKLVSLVLLMGCMAALRLNHNGENLNVLTATTYWGTGMQDKQTMLGLTRSGYATANVDCNYAFCDLVFANDQKGCNSLNNCCVWTNNSCYFKTSVPTPPATTPAVVKSTTTTAPAKTTAAPAKTTAAAPAKTTTTTASKSTTTTTSKTSSKGK